MSLDGNGFIELEQKLIDHNIDFNWKMKINISTYQPNGLLLWQGQIQQIQYDQIDTTMTSIDDNYLALGIQNGNVVFVSNGVSLYNGATLINGQNHQIQLIKQGTKIILKLDDNSVNGNYPNLENEILMDQLKGADIFIGGLQKNDLNFNNGYVQLSIRDYHISLPLQPNQN